MKTGCGESQEMDNVGITGSSGFLGGYLLQFLKENKINAIPYDGNLLNPSDLETYFSVNKIKIIVHLAGTFNLPFSNLIEKNVLTTENLLEVGSKFGLKKIIYASSGAVYGEPKGEMSLESDLPCPNTLYGLSKLYAEECIIYYARKVDMQYAILRFPNIYGKENNKGVISSLIKDIKEKGYVTIYGDGNQSRNFLHVLDACRSIKKAIDYNSSNIFNVSTPARVTINDLVNMLSKRYQFSIRYEKEDNELKDLILNTDKVKRILMFSPKFNNIQLW